MRIKKIALMVMLFQMFLSSVMLGDVLAFNKTSKRDLVGVKVGDWVKYNVIRTGQSIAWVPPPMEKAVWVKVEVQNVSDTTVVIHETIYLLDGSSNTRTFSLDLRKEIRFGSYILAANLNKGDKILADRVVAINSTHLKRVKELSVNATVSRSYDGLTREVNLLKWSYLMPFFQSMYNFTEEYYWDKKTGFLLERIWQVYTLGYKNASLSTLQLKIAETNIWKMETGDKSMWNQLWPWVAICFGLAVVAGATIFMRLPRNLRRRTEVYEKE